MAQHNDFGNQGEEIATDYLLKKGYSIRERNWRYRKAEVDIIAQKDGVLAIVEVKTRSSNYFGNPQDFVNKKKMQLLTEAIDEYVNKYDLNIEVRFDIIAILKNKNEFNIEHLEDAFFHF